MTIYMDTNVSHDVFILVLATIGKSGATSISYKKIINLYNHLLKRADDEWVDRQVPLFTQ